MILQNLSESKELEAMWDKYRKEYSYAKEIEYDDILSVIKELTIQFKLINNA